MWSSAAYLAMMKEQRQLLQHGYTNKFAGASVEGPMLYIAAFEATSLSSLLEIGKVPIKIWHIALICNTCRTRATHGSATRVRRSLLSVYG